MMTKLSPFADAAASVSIGSITVEKAILDQALLHLQAEKGLLEALPAASTPKTVRNPFA